MLINRLIHETMADYQAQHGQRDHFKRVAVVSGVIALTYAVAKVLLDPQVVDVTGVVVETVAALVLALAAWAFTVTLAGLGAKRCLLAVLPLSLAFYGVRLATPLPRTAGDLAGHAAFLATLVVATALLATGIGHVPGRAVRRLRSAA